MSRLAAALKGSISIVAACGLLLQGCAQEGGSSTGASQVGLAVAADDPCAANRQTLKQHDDYFVASIVGGSAAGAMAAGLATGSLIRGLIGAAAGAAAGGIGGYYAYKRDNFQNKTRLIESIHGDVAREVQEVDRTTANFLALAQCRFNVAQAVNADLRAQRISRADAEARIARQRVLFNEDVAFAESLGAKMTQRGSEFEIASTELLKDDPEAQKQLEQRRAEQAQLEADAAAAAAATRTPAPPARTAAPRPAPAAAAPAPAASAPAPAASAPAPAASPAPAARAPAAAAAPRPAQAAVQPTQRTRTLPVAATPVDAAGVSQLTDSNRIKRREFGEQVTDAKTTAETALKIDATISRAPATASAG